MDIRTVILDAARFTLGAGILVYQTVTGQVDVVLTLGALGLAGWQATDQVLALLSPGSTRGRTSSSPPGQSSPPTPNSGASDQ